MQNSTYMSSPAGTLAQKPGNRQDLPVGDQYKSADAEKPMTSDKLILISCAISVAATIIGMVALYYIAIDGAPNATDTGSTTETKRSDGAVGETKLGLGITGEKWNDLSGTRKAGVTYTNKYPYPIAVSLTATTGSANGYLRLHVGGVEAVMVTSYDPSNPNARYNTLSAIVPPGSTYVLTLAGGDSSLNRWSELY